MDENKDVQQAAPLSEARKTALLRYMAVLFAAAFLLVLLSLILQAHSSKETISELTQTSSSALSNVEQLQTQNRNLQDDVQALTKENEALNEQLAALQAELEQARQDAEQAETEDDAARLALRTELSRTKDAYEALLVAKSCETHEGNVTFSKAMDTLTELKDYLGTEARAEYETLLAE